MSDEQTFAEKIVEAVSDGKIARHQGGTWVTQKSFDRLLAVLVKAIEQRDEWIMSDEYYDAMNAELLLTAKGEAT